MSAIQEAFSDWIMLKPSTFGNLLLFFKLDYSFKQDNQFSTALEAQGSM